MLDADEVTEEILADGTKIRIIKKKDGTIVRKVVKETEGQKKLNELKRLKDEQGGLAEEEAKIEYAKKKLNEKKDNLEKLKIEKEPRCVSVPR